MVLSLGGACENAPVKGDPAPPALASPGVGARGSAPPPVDPAVSRALGGLAPGDPLGPASVDSISDATAGLITVQVRMDRSTARLLIALRTESPEPPVSTARYSVYWSDQGLGTNRLVGALLIEVCQALAERLRRAESTAAPPAELRQFSPAAKTPSPPL